MRAAARGLAIVVAVSLAAVSASAAAPASTARFHLTSSLIVPGKSIGNLRLGMTESQIAAFLGRGALGTRHPGLAAYYQYGNAKTGTYQVLFYGRPRRAVVIGELTGVMHTAGGIRLGSTLEQVKAGFSVHCERSLVEATEPTNARGLCDAQQPAGRTTRFTFTDGTVAVIGVAQTHWVKPLREPV
jgi:hypothetical protein